MKSNTVLVGSHTSQVRRVGALLQVAFLAAFLLASPALHRKHCTGACAMRQQAAVFGASGHGCCGTCGHGHSTTDDDGCQCLGDCCSIVGHCATPTVVCDTAPPAPAPDPVPPAPPVEAPRTPSARLLPYPTGPPSIV